VPFRRDNVFFEVHKIPAGFDGDFVQHPVFEKIFDDLTKNGEKAARSVVFVRPAIKNVQRMFTLAGVALADLQEEKVATLVNMFHGSTPETVKQRILDMLRDAGSPLRLCFCSSALALGVDMRAVSCSINVRTPESFTMYIQEAGRAGRVNAGADSFPARSILLYTPRDLLSVEKEMKEYLLTSGCRRVFISRYLHPDVSVESLNPSTDCCDNCLRGPQS
jgi:superfamily II DNA helicase RecQ